MANRRMLSKSISTSKKLSKLTDFAALLFIMLIPHGDDAGNMDAEPYAVKGIAVPLFLKNVEEIATALNQIADVGLISFYEVGGEKYLHINQWEKHQTLRLDRAQYSYPEYTAFNKQSEGKIAIGGKLKKQKKPQGKKGMKPVLAKEKTVDGSGINKLIELFKAVNPNYENLYPRMSERDALDRMVKKFGQEKVENTIRMLPSVIFKKTAPRITTPRQLEENLGKLIVFWKQENSGSGKGKDLQ